jgi:hypothetical protein
MALADDLRGQFEAGLSYPNTYPGVFHTYDASTRALAEDLDAAEGRVRPPRSTQRTLNRYLRGERAPRPERMRTLRRLARGRVATQRLTPFRARGARVQFVGVIRISASIRLVRFDLALVPAQMPGTFAGAEAGMRTGRWERAAREFNREVLEEAYGQGLIDVAEVQEVRVLNVTPL